MDSPQPTPRERGLQAYQQGQLDLAAELLGESTRAEPRDCDAWLLLGILQSQRGAHPQAEEALQRALSLQPWNAVFHFNLGAARERAGDAARAVQAYQAAQQLDSTHAASRERLRALRPDLVPTPIPAPSLPGAWPLAGSDGAVAGSPIDARPSVHRNRVNSISRAEAERDRLFAYFEQICREERVEAWVVKSPPFHPEVFIAFICWLPHPHRPELTDRTSVRLVIRPKDFYRFDHEIDITIQEGLRTRRFERVIEFGLDDARALVRYLLRRTQGHVVRFQRCQRMLLEFWLPRNYLTGLQWDLASHAPTPLAVAGIITVQMVPLLGFGLIAGSVGTMVYNQLRRAYSLSSGQPEQEPRVLVRLDSWQTLLYEMGPERPAIKAALEKELRRASQEGFGLADERIWYLGVNGVEEREQMVVTLRRAIGFVHVYTYGRDLYLGWDVHVNGGSWKERPAGTGTDPKTGLFCRASTLEAGWHTPTEYDLTDANCLVEWVHGAATRVIKNALAEHKIDQEIDFEIQRGDRQSVAGKADPRGAGVPGLGRRLPKLQLTREA